MDGWFLITKLKDVNKCSYCISKQEGQIFLLNFCYASMCSIFLHMSSYQFKSLKGHFAKAHGVQSAIDLVKVSKIFFIVTIPKNINTLNMCLFVFLTNSIPFFRMKTVFCSCVTCTSTILLHY